MHFDPEAFGKAMGEAIREAVAPLTQRIAELEKRLESMPIPANGKDGSDGVPGAAGKDCDMVAVKTMVDDFLKSVRLPKDGKDGADGKDGSSITMQDVRPLIDEAVKSIRDESRQAVEVAIKAIPTPKDGRDGRDGKDGVDGKDGAPGEKGADGIGMAGSMIDRDGNLLVTMTNGEVKNLGAVVGKDGRDGVDGIGLDSFDLEYLEETHEIRIKAACAGRVKEVKFTAGGIRPGGYWREGTKAKAGEVYTHDGTSYVAKCDTLSKPDGKGDWVILSRKGRDGETIVKTVSSEPPAPIKLKNGNFSRTGRGPESNPRGQNGRNEIHRAKIG